MKAVMLLVLAACALRAADVKEDPKAYADRARSEALAGDYEGALKDCDAGLALKPGDAALLAARAAADNGLGRPQNALDEAARAIDDNPKEALAWLEKGLAREKLAEGNDEYLDDIKNAGDLDPAFASTYQEALSRRASAKPTAAVPATEKKPLKPGVLTAAVILCVLSAVLVVVVRRKAG